MKLAVVFLATLVLAGCNRGGIENKEAVRQAVIDYLAARSNLNIGSMNVDVSSVTFKGNEADATVSFAPKGGAAGQGMSMRYALERKGNRWVVKGRGNGSGAHGMGADSASPHGGMPAMPGGPGAASPSGEMPPGHPPAAGPGKK
ncbi:MAG TPA: hypothetical protein VN442_15405 [Bryobacteraceae bacterium]|nr:hypothetical protein [Bryobacteraceae bacterium]